MTDTAKMKIETGDQHQIKNRSYCVPLNKRYSIVDKAITKMIDAKIITISFGSGEDKRRVSSLFSRCIQSLKKAWTKIEAKGV